MILWTFVSCRVPVATTFTCRCIDDWSPEWNHALKTLPHHISTGPPKPRYYGQDHDP